MYIYLTEDLTNGMRYVGLSTFTPEESTDYLGSGHWLNRAIKKRGRAAFRKTILEDGITDKKALAQRERHWIKELNTQKPNGYNLTSGGDGAPDLPPETRERIRAANKLRVGPLSPMWGKKMSPEACRKIGDAHRGKKATPETRRKLSESHIGKLPSEEARRKLRKHWDSLKGKPRPKAIMEASRLASCEAVVQLTHAGEYIATFPSHVSAARAIQMTPGAVTQCVRGTTRYCGDYRFISLEDYDLIRSAGASVEPLSVSKRGKRLLPTNRLPGNTKAVVQLTPEGQYVATHLSVTRAGNAVGISRASVLNVLSGKQQLSGGFAFMPEEDYHCVRSAGATIGPFAVRDTVHPHRRGVARIDPMTRAVIATYPSISEAARACGAHSASIQRCVHGQMKQTKGMCFAFAETPDPLS